MCACRELAGQGTFVVYECKQFDQLVSFIFISVTRNNSKMRNKHVLLHIPIMSLARPAAHCRVLLLHEFNGVIPDVMSISSESYMIPQLFSCAVVMVTNTGDQNPIPCQSLQ